MTEDLKLILSCIDNTTLEGSDNAKKVEELCHSSLHMQDAARGINPVAAVCVYPVFARQAKELLKGSGINVACVAGAFPAGQSPIDIKAAEVKYAVAEGADEIDMVISRGALLEGDFDRVRNEVIAIKEACNGRRLKVILETGELQSPENIRKASQLAIEGGADFIKTSTGKIAVNATLEAAEVMLQEIASHRQQTGKLVGFKAAGGISTPEQALPYLEFAKKYLGVENTNKQFFRIGASRLTKKIYALLTEQNG